MPMIASSMMPRDMNDLVPEAMNAQLLAEPYSFFLDKDESGSCIIYAYQNFDGKKRQLISINKSSGLLPD